MNYLKKARKQNRNYQNQVQPIFVRLAQNAANATIQKNQKKNYVNRIKKREKFVTEKAKKNVASVYFGCFSLRRQLKRKNCIIQK